MKIPVYHVNAFTESLFAGNPAAVCLLSEWLTEEFLHALAKENNLPVTVFLVRNYEGYDIRWITPDYELALCGHGSLAAAYVIFNFLDPAWESIALKSRQESFHISRQDNLITLAFSPKYVTACQAEAGLLEGLSIWPTEIYHLKNERYLLVYDDEVSVKNIILKMDILKNITHRGITITDKGTDCDFVSRTFYPHKTLTEDAVTGAAHCLLVPYWSKKLAKKDLFAKQLSARGGEIFCVLEKESVLLSGKAVLFMKGEIHLSLDP